MKYLVIVLSFVCLIEGYLSHLSLSDVKCGSKICKYTEYCSEFDNLCQPCSGICDVNHHNLDQKKCEQECQNYLYEIRFGMSQSNDSDLRAEVRYLHYMVSITLAITCIMLACVGIFLLLRFIKWKKKHEITMAWIRSKFNKKEKNNKQVPAVAVTHISGKPDLRLEMPPMPTRTPGTTGTTPSTASTGLSRRPTEDSTLDYAYDNPAMATTPSPNNKVSKPHESSL